MLAWSHAAGRPHGYVNKYSPGERNMADWEDALRELLACLEVVYDGRASGTLPELPSRDDGADASGELDPSALALEARAVRTDMEATLARLDQLTQVGQLERAVRDDFVVAVRALMRPLPKRATPAEQEEWQVTSAAAALRLSRAVMRLTFRMAPPIER